MTTPSNRDFARITTCFVTMTAVKTSPYAARRERARFQGCDEVLGGNAMHARMTQTQGKPDKVEEASRLFRESIIPAAKQQKGFAGAMAFANRTTGQGVTITLWESEADLSASEKNGYYQAQLAKAGQLLTAPPKTERFEVTAFDTVKEKLDVA
jgi:heme-degrading monooxygenase HmoA